MKRLATFVATVIAMLAAAQPAAADPTFTFAIMEGQLNSPTTAYYQRWIHDGSDVMCDSLTTGDCSTDSLKSLSASVWAQVPMKHCETATEDYCVDSVSIYHDGDIPTPAEFQYEAFPNIAKPEPAPQLGIPSLGNPLIYKSSTETSPQGSDLFMVQTGIHYNIKPEYNYEARISEFKMSVFPVVANNRNNFSVQPFKPGTRVAISVRVPKEVGGWFKGRLGDSHASITPFDDADYTLTVDALNVTIPQTSVTMTDAQLKQLQADHPGTWPSWFKACEGGCGIGGEGDGGFDVLDQLRSIANDTSAKLETGWYLISFPYAQYLDCAKGVTGLVGLVSTNATVYTGFPPPLSDAGLQYQIGAFHLQPDGVTPNTGDYDLLIQDKVARCIYGLPDNGNLDALINVSENGAIAKATTSFEDENGFAHFSAKDFHFSSPVVSMKLKVVAAPKFHLGASIQGSTAVGGILQASGRGIPAGYATKYSWVRDGTAISGATSSTYQPTTADLGHRLSVVLTLVASGKSSLVHSSAQTPAISLGSQVLKPTPTLSGSARVGQKLSVNTGVWDANAKLSIQWMRDGSAIMGATSSKLRLAPSDIGHTFAAKVTSSKAGYKPVSRVSAPSQAVSLGSQVLKPIPTISGVLAVGSTLTAIPGSWDSGTSLSYQWMRDGSDVLGAVATTLALTPADLGHTISVKVTSSKIGYVTVSSASASSVAVALGTLPALSGVKLSGVAKVGKLLKVTILGVPAGASVAYKWMRDGLTQPKAIKASYLLGAQDANKVISARVRVTLPGYVPITATVQSSKVKGK